MSSYEVRRDYRILCVCFLKIVPTTADTSKNVHGHGMYLDDVRADSEYYFVYYHWRII